MAEGNFSEYLSSMSHIVLNSRNASASYLLILKDDIIERTEICKKMYIESHEGDRFA